MTPLRFPAAFSDESRAAVRVYDVGYSALDKGLVGTSLQMFSGPQTHEDSNVGPFSLVLAHRAEQLHDALIATGEDVICTLEALLGIIATHLSTRKDVQLDAQLKSRGHQQIQDYDDDYSVHTFPYKVGQSSKALLQHGLHAPSFSSRLRPSLSLHVEPITPSVLMLVLLGVPSIWFLYGWLSALL
ncbi:hypothetical protein K443DRAFT_8367 [Laccaria amethystina LaAM-08-1]|uniref:Uncharacterized protein n=1 Tax=Laccaria amethystina LaAM-08-1 TaxID=1095629 RepID=A0A0C9WNZ3_9AGAR|nr:hypothetical protein K443DRAFT_8367 [Laccaria amethystina LaAM-08-1]